MYGMEKVKVQFRTFGMSKLIVLLAGILLLLILIIGPARAHDPVRLGLMGQWSNNYGEFNAIEVLDGAEFQDYGDPEDNYAFCATSKGMVVFGVRKDPNSQSTDVSLKSFVPIGDCTDIEIKKDERGGCEKNIYAYITAGSEGIYIRNIINPEFSYHMAKYDTPGSARGVAVLGDYAYVADGVSGLQVIDISDPNEPKIAGGCYTPGSATGVAVSGDYAYVVDGSRGLQVIDISDPNEPKIAGGCDTPDHATGVAVSGDYAYMADDDSGLQVIDISDPNDPKIAGGYYTRYYAYGVAVSGDYAYVADWSRGLQVIDISDKNGPKVAGSCDTPGSATGVAVSGDYAYVVDGSRGLQVIDISDPNEPKIAGGCDTPDYATGVAVSGDYAYVADYDSGLQVIDISDPNEPKIAGGCDTPGHAYGVAVLGDYVYVADKSLYHIFDWPPYSYWYSGGLQVIDISDPNRPNIAGTCYPPGSATGVAVSGDYAYVANHYSGLQVIDISDPNRPKIAGGCDTLGSAIGVAVSGDYAYVADYGSGLQVIDISDPNEPKIAGGCDTPGHAEGVAVLDDYAYVADKSNGLLQFKINIGPPPKGKGNLILVAGGNINYWELAQQAAQATKTLSRARFKISGEDEQKMSYWHITQALANQVFKTFIDQGYEVYDIYYFNPDPAQDIDGVDNQLVVDESIPTSDKLQSVIKQLPDDHLANDGPLYIYLIGHGAQDNFLITSNEVIDAKDLQESIRSFQTRTGRKVVVIIEAASSGTFIDSLMDPNILDITVITSTNDGASYIKPNYTNPDLPYSFTTEFISALAPSLDPNRFSAIDPNDVSATVQDDLKKAFNCARNQLETWAGSGPPFNNQAPQMGSTGDEFTALYFSEDGIHPLDHLSIHSIDENLPWLTIIGQSAHNDTYTLLPDDLLSSITFFSSDPNIFGPVNIEDIQPIMPKKNGRITLIAYADPNLVDPDLYLSAKLTLEVSIDDPNFYADTGKMAIIVAGYKGSGDYLFKSTNTIANHAYKTLRAMGYTKEEIFYYNPYFLQDLDENGQYDDIDGYPKPDIFDPNTSLESPYSALARISQKGATELFLSLVDHGDKGSFCLNPTYPSPSGALTAHDLIDLIVGTEGHEGIADKVEDKIIFLYDACYSGSFLSEVKGRVDQGNPNDTLGKKLITITSTDPNQAAYFLNSGVVSFSYPFFDEWFLTNSLTDAFAFAKDVHPLQDPDMFDLDVADTWDEGNRYYVDESRPIIDEVHAWRMEGELYITANVFSLTGVNKVWAIAGSDHKPVYGEAITEATEFILSYDPNDGYTDPDQYGGHFEIITPDPLPNEPKYPLYIYAIDKSSRPKITSYSTGIDDTSGENKTKTLIIYTDPNFYSDPLFSPLNEQDGRDMMAQVNRTTAILASIGEGDITATSGKDITGPDDLPDITLTEDQTLFIYMIGQAGFAGNTPYFYLNPNAALTPDDLKDYISPFADNRLLILMDSPYSSQFLAHIDPNGNHEKWACLAGTDQGGLFFPIKGPSERRFPCFSHFFLSMTLAGATVAQAYRMADKAVSLTRQNPQCFLPVPENEQSALVINRHLSYYLGSSGIAGEDYSLIKSCAVEYEDLRYYLSFTTPPGVVLTKAWAVLVSSPSSFFDEVDPVDFDPNNGEIDIEGILYEKEWTSTKRVCIQTP